MVGYKNGKPSYEVFDNSKASYQRFDWEPH